MKRLVVVLGMASMLYGAEGEEVAAFEPGALVQQPFSLRELPEPVVKVRTKSPFLAVGLSALVPGLGHTYLGEMGTAGGLFGTACATVGVGMVPGGRDFELTGLVAAQNTWAYGLYAAYRDVRVYNGQLGYGYRMPMDSLADLSSAPFRFSVMKKVEVWGGLLGALALGIGTAYFAFPQDACIHLSRKMEISPLAALPVGVGEESLFRGLLQSQLTEYLTPWGGIAVSSLAFGAMHIPNGMALEPEHRWRYYAFGLPLITGMGTYFGWLTHKNHSLKESVAVHTWYDFILFSAGALASRAAITGRSEIGFSTSF